MVVKYESKSQKSSNFRYYWRNCIFHINDVVSDHAYQFCIDTMGIHDSDWCYRYVDCFLGDC